MALFTTVNMIEKEYLTASQDRKNVTFIFKTIPSDRVSTMPHQWCEPDIAQMSHMSSQPEPRSVIGEDDRTIVENAHRNPYAAPTGRLEVLFPGNTTLKYATGFRFADNWVMTAATNIYNPLTDSFASAIQFFPAISGNADNAPYPRVTVTQVYIPEAMKDATDPTTGYSDNYAFLKLDENASMPDEYLGFRYQPDSFVGSLISTVGYPNDLPVDANESVKGTYMYRCMKKVVAPNALYWLYHLADTSDGNQGSPLMIYWNSNVGWEAIGMDVYSVGAKNLAIRITPSIFGVMKELRNGKTPILKYVQPEKPDNSALNNILTIIDDIETLGNYVIEYNAKNSKKTTLSMLTIKVCNYLRSMKYNSRNWAITLWEEIDESFIEFVKTHDSELYNRLYKYIRNTIEDQKNEELRDNGNGIIDLPHLAATLEAYVKPLTPFPAYWAGWGGDLATGIADYNKVIKTYAPENLTTYIRTYKSYEIIGKINTRCNFSDMCCDFDSIKIAEMISDAEKDVNINTDNLTDGVLLASLLRIYYTDYYQNRFQYFLKDINCSLEADSETIVLAVKNKLSLPDNIVLLTAFAETLDGEIIEPCCEAFANYILCEL